MSCSENIQKMCSEIIEFKNCGYSMSKLHMYIYSIIGENMIVHKKCNNCQFYFLTEFINDMYNKYRYKDYDQYYLLNRLWYECDKLK